VARASVFIDGGYLKALLKTLFGEPRIDFGKIGPYLAGTDELVRTYYFYAPPYKSPHRPTKEELERYQRYESFVTSLRRLPRFQIIEGSLKKRRCSTCNAMNFVQKGVDVKLAIELLVQAQTRHIERAVLLAGDGDLVPAVAETKRLGVQVILWHARRAVPAPGVRVTVDDSLWSQCDERHEITLDDISALRL